MSSAYETEKSEQDAGENKYLTFVLREEEYALMILKVQEIIGIQDITPVPRTPEYVKGVINLRGKIIPVIDLRLKFGIEELEYSKETCIIVLEVEGEEHIVTMGVIVDRVSEVVTIPEGRIEGTPDFGVNINTDFILGIGKTEGDRVVMLLDADKILSSKEVEAMWKVGGSINE